MPGKNNATILRQSLTCTILLAGKCGSCGIHCLSRKTLSWTTHLNPIGAGLHGGAMLGKLIRCSAVLVCMVLTLLGGTWAQNTPGMPTMPHQAPATQPFVSTLFADNMVLQRGKTNTIWGWSEPGDKITVQILSLIHI